MREKLKTLPLSELKELAKAQGLRGISTMRKADIIELLCRQAERPQSGQPQTEQSQSNQAQTEQPQSGQSQTERPQPNQAQAEQPHSKQSQTERFQSNQAQPERPQSGQPQAERPQSNQAQSERPSMPVRRASLQDNRNPSGEGRRNYTRTYDRYGQNRTVQGKSAGSSHGGQGSGTGNAGNANAPQSRPTQAQSQSAAASAPAPSAESGERTYRSEQRNDAVGLTGQDIAELDSGIGANGILEVMPDGFGFLRCENFLPGENDVYVAPSQIRRFNLKTGDIIEGNRRVKSATEKFAALLYIKTVNGYPLSSTETRPNFEDLTPIFPNQRLHMENPRERTSVAMRVLDLLSPVGKGQRGMIVSPPKAGKTTLLKQVAKAVTTNHPEMHLMILLIDERPEEVTDIKEAIVGPNVEVIYSTFDELPERHKRVSEMVIERAKRLVEHGRDVIILLDSITRLARAYNLTVAPSGRTLSGGLDPAALHMPKRFFGAARNMREGGSLTILATALVDTGSRMDDVVYEEFKGTGNMELVLDRKLSEKRIFPAIDILKSGTRRDDLLLNREEAEAVDIIHKATSSLKPEDAVEKILDLFSKTRNNREFTEMVKKIRLY